LGSLQLPETNQTLQTLLGDSKVRKIFHEGKWYYSITDLISVALDLPLKDTRNYVYSLKKRLQREGDKHLTKYKMLKLTSSDGKKYETEVITLEQTLRLLQSISSPKIESIKTWLAYIGTTNYTEETFDPK
jgi:hypothetical protein